MDIRCPKCGEPWDMDELHYVDSSVHESLRRSFDDVYASFRRKGCIIFDGASCNVDRHPDTELFAAVAELLGDDVDGCAAMLEDYEALS